MTKINQDIDFIEIYKILWKGKLFLFSCLIISILLGFLTINNVEKKFESKIFISTNNFISSYNSTNISFSDEDIIRDFQDILYSETLFSNWNAENESKLIYKDLKSTKLLGNTKFSSKNKLIELNYDMMGNKYLFSPVTILIRSNDSKFIGDFHKYLIYVNNQLNTKYINALENEINFIEDLIININDSKEQINLDSYILKKITLDKLLKSSILRITQPSTPLKTAPKSVRVLLMFLIVGGMASVFIVFLRDFINKTK